MCAACSSNRGRKFAWVGILKVMYDHELNLLHINPGAAGTHGWQRQRTLIRLKIDGDKIFDLEVIELGKLSV